MIILRLFGGLGNQLFQYATAFALSKRIKQRIYIDKLFYESQSKRNITLENFKIPELNYLPRFLALLFRKKWFVEALITLRLITKKNNQSYYNSSNLFIILDDYFQSPEYFQEYKDQIKQLFIIKIFQSTTYRSYLNEIKTSESVSVHVRRGDYLNYLILGILALDYYINAKELIAKRVSNPRFFIFSDDITWSKNNLSSLFYEAIFVENCNDSETIELMRECKHHILANSSFSWWAAWLADHEQGLIIHPQKHFQEITISENYYPKSWIPIPNSFLNV